MSLKSRKRKTERLTPKMSAFYENYTKWLAREPSTSNPVLHGRWETEEPVKPKWLVEYEADPLFKLEEELNDIY